MKLQRSREITILSATPKNENITLCIHTNCYSTCKVVGLWKQLYNEYVVMSMQHGFIAMINKYLCTMY